MVENIGHAVPEILGFVGFLLLGILALALFGLLLLLLVPVRYQIWGRREKAGDREWEQKIRLRISWLFGMVCGELSYPGEGGPVIKILGLPLKRKKRKAAEAGPAGRAGEDTAGESASQKEASGEDFSERETDLVNEGRDMEDCEGKSCEDDQTGEEDVQDEPEELTGWKKTEYTILNLCDKISGLGAKLTSVWEVCSHYTELLSDRETEALLKKLAVYGPRLLRSILPKSVKGYLMFGTGDPAYTGYLWGMLSMALGGRTDGLQVEPDFENALLRGRMHVKGRIYGIVLLINGLPVLLAPELGHVRRRLKNGGIKHVRQQ